MTSKIAVSLPDHLVTQARDAVSEGRAASVSAYVAEALAEKSGRESLDEVLTAWDSELGPAGAQERAWAASVLRVSE